MKVNVLQVEQTKFLSRWSWWSNWIDVATFTYEHQPYLLQMRVSRTNKKVFRDTRMTGGFYRQATAEAIGDLTTMTKVTP